MNDAAELELSHIHNHIRTVTRFLSHGDAEEFYDTLIGDLQVDLQAMYEDDYFVADTGDLEPVLAPDVESLL